MGILDRTKKLFEMQKKVKEIEKKMLGIIIETPKYDGKVKVAFDGKLNLKSIHIDDELLNPQCKQKLIGALENAIRETLNKAQKIAADSFKEVAGDLGLGGGFDV